MSECRYPCPSGQPDPEVLLTIIEIHSYWICPVCWGVAAMIEVAPRDRGAGLTRVKSGAWSAFVGSTRLTGVCGLVFVWWEEYTRLLHNGVGALVDSCPSYGNHVLDGGSFR